MGWVDKIKRMTGNDVMDEYDDNEGYYGGAFGDDGYDGVTEYAQPENTADQGGYTPAGMGMGMGSSISSLGGAAIELKVVKPERFDCVPQIADHLLNKRTVVLNLEATNKETARRLIDFLSGVAYSIDGQLKRIANNAYVITPNNVDVSGEQLREKKAKKEEEPAGDFYSDL
ncbi:MAG: cell division protein SepF [Clostridia bacterium]|nr:cell division protein SepF [Clostridia bacterium]